MNNRILNLAIPSIISNITVPLLGIIDVAIVGHLSNVNYIGAISVGSTIFSMIYWIFVFLRMGTSGTTAQSYGKRDISNANTILFRSLFVSVIIASFLILLQSPILNVALLFIEGNSEIILYASQYYEICIWGAIPTLALYSFSGWFIGMQNTKIPMIVAIVQNILNIICSLLFVFVFNMDIKGVASGTLIAQWSGFTLSVIFWIIFYNKRYVHISISQIYALKELKYFFIINSDIFLRTLCLVSVTVYFTSASSRYGEFILAANAILMQMFLLFSYIMDGFAYAGEALTGLYVGANNMNMLHKCVRYLFKWGILLSIIFSFVYIMFGEDYIQLMTIDKDVRLMSNKYLIWASIIPIVSFSAFVWDGIYIGATDTRKMLYSMISATSVFFAIHFSYNNILNNNAIWLAFVCYLATRGVVQTFLGKRYIK